MKIIEILRTCHGRFTANYSKFLASHSIYREMWYDFTPTFLKIWKIWALCFHRGLLCRSPPWLKPLQRILITNHFIICKIFCSFFKRSLYSYQVFRKGIVLGWQNGGEGNLAFHLCQKFLEIPTTKQRIRGSWLNFR